MALTPAQEKNIREELTTVCRMIRSDKLSVALVAVVVDLETGDATAHTMLARERPLHERIIMLSKIAQTASHDISTIMYEGQ